MSLDMHPRATDPVDPDGARPEGTSGAVTPSADPTVTGASAFGPATPWPPHHVPRTPGEVRLWLSFALLRVDPEGPLDVKLVATRIGMSRTAIAYDGCAHKVLRKAVLEEIDARETARAAAATRVQAARVGPSRPVRGIRYWQAIAQRADSRIIEHAAAATREAAKSRRSRELLRRIFDDMKAGRWKRVDEEAVMMADLAAELGPVGGA